MTTEVKVYIGGKELRNIIKTSVSSRPERKTPAPLLRTLAEKLHRLLHRFL